MTTTVFFSDVFLIGIYSVGRFPFQTIYSTTNREHQTLRLCRMIATTLARRGKMKYWEQRVGKCLAPGVSCLDVGAATDVPTWGYRPHICSDRKRDILRLAFRHLSRHQRMDVEDQFGMG